MIKKRNSKEEKIDKVLDKFITQFGYEKRFKEHEVIEVFSEIMGPFLMKKVKSVYVNQNKLFLQLTSAPFKEEIKMQKTVLVQQINKKLNNDFLKDVVVR